MQQLDGFERFAGRDGPLPAAEVTTLTVWLGALCRRVADTLDGRVGPTAEPSLRVWWATAARLFAAHAADFGALVPESVLLDEARKAAPPAAVEALADVLADAPSITAGRHAIGPLAAVVAALPARLSAVSDAALRRQLRIFAADLAELSEVPS